MISRSDDCKTRSARSIETGVNVRLYALAVFCVTLLSLSGTSLAADMDQINLFHIEAQELDTALTEFANEANVQVMFAFDPGIGRRWTSGLNGRYTRAQALTALLAGTRLAFVESGKFVEIVSRNAARTVGPTSNIVLRQPSLIHDGQPPDDPPEAVSVEPSTKPGAKLSQPKENHAEEQLQEVVVTGSQIAGVTELASPLLVFSRADFDDSGVSTIQQFMDQQPANFGGGASEATVGDLAGGGGADNTVQGSGFNLRGLGSDSTLVLINGRRLAAGNIDANFVDTSLIPLSAIQRVEIDPDGASAIYGSDAVGGVVNLILRQNFDGAETRLRYGTVSQSGTREVQASQVLGHSWGSGSVLAGYEYYDRTPLFASDRAYASLQPEPFALLPEQVRQSGFVTARDSLTDRVDVFADGLYARRETDFTYTFPTFVSSVGPADTQLYATSFGADASLSDSVMLELTGTYSGSQTEEQDLFNGESVAALNVRSTLESFDAKASGRLCTIRTGSVMFAVGGQLRREALASADLTARSDFTPSRSIAAGFLELQVPLVRPSEGSAVRDPFALSLAGRYEHYSDFGSTFNPNLGLIWRPIGFFKIRGTYGTSFKAPLLSDENPVPTEVAAQTESDPTTGGLTNVLEVFGGNPKLKPEKANIWTAGVDLQGNGASFHATYYNIRFTDVIANIQAEGIDVSNALSAESELGPSVIARNPSVQEVASLAAAPAFVDLTGIPGGINLATVGAIVDSRDLNLARIVSSGVDMDAAYSHPVPGGTLETGVSTSYTLDFRRQQASAFEPVGILNTPYNPVNLKARARAIFRRGGLTVAAYGNFVNSYEDNRGTTPVPISSWTTMDFTIRYAAGGGAGLLSETEVSLSTVNAANKAPPFVNSPAPLFEPGITFDGANANVLGRVIALELVKKW